MAEAELATHEWWEHYKETVNAEQEMTVRGHDKFDENFYVQVDDERFLVEMNSGDIDEIIPNPGMNHSWSFGVEGSRDAWEEFVQEVPPPFNHEIIASHYRSTVKNEPGHLRLTGDNKHIFQNLRAFQCTLDMMRKAHNNGGNL